MVIKPKDGHPMNRIRFQMVSSSRELFTNRYRPSASVNLGTVQLRNNVASPSIQAHICPHFSCHRGSRKDWLQCILFEPRSWVCRLAMMSRWLESNCTFYTEQPESQFLWHFDWQIVSQSKGHTCSQIAAIYTSYSQEFNLNQAAFIWSQQHSCNFSSRWVTGENPMTRMADAAVRKVQNA